MVYDRGKGPRLYASCEHGTAQAAKTNAIFNPISNARTIQSNRDKALAAASASPSLSVAIRLSDSDLKLLAVDCLRRPEVAALYAHGARAYVYCFQWTGEHPEGWGASPKALMDCEQTESLSHLLRPNPVLQHRSGKKIQRGDLFCDDSGVHIIRLAISPCLSDITLVEKTIHTLTEADTVGFRGHLKKGGSSARQKSYVYGCSLLVIPDLVKLHLEGSELARSFGNETGGLPFSVILGADGGIIDRKMGQLTPELLARWQQAARA